MPLKFLKIKMVTTQEEIKTHRNKTNKLRSINSCYRNSKKHKKTTITKME